MILEEFIKKSPKAELHLHIEGTLEPELMFSLAKRNNIEIPFKNIDDVEKNVVSLLKLISQSENFNSLIKDPTNNQEDQINVINIIFEKFNLNNLLKKFLNFLIVKRRFFYIEKILKDFVIICSKNRGEIFAKLTSLDPL